MPRITTITDGGGGLFTVAGHLFQHDDLLPEDIQVYIGENRLTFVSGAVIAAGEFRIAGVNAF